MIPTIEYRRREFDYYKERETLRHKGDVQWR